MTADGFARSVLFVRIAAGAFLAAHLVGDAIPGAWGLDALSGASGAERAAFAIAGLVIATFPYARVAGAAGALRARFASRGGQTALLAVAFTVFFMFRPSALPLLGDGSYQLRDLQRIADGADWRIRWQSENAPLCTWARLHAFDALRARGVSAEGFLRGASVLSGAAFVLVAAFGAAALAGRRAGRHLTLALLLTGGWLQLFCGYMETYPLVAPVLLLYLVLGARSSDGHDSWTPALCLGLLVAMHFSMFSLLPSLFLSGMFATRAPAAPARWLGGAARVALALVVAAGLLAAIGFDAREFANVPRAPIAPLAGPLGFRHNWHLVSWAHVRDVLNQILLAAPALLLALPLLRFGGKKVPGAPATPDSARFLLVAGAVPFAFTLVANPEVGAFRDWDVFALPAIAATAWLAAHLVRHMPGPALATAGAVLAAASALHVFAWTSLNADAARAEARFERQLDGPALSRHARSYGWESLAGLRRDRGEDAAAAEAWQKAADHARTNVRLWNATADAQLRLGREEPARAAWLAAWKQSPEDPDANFGLGALAFRAGDHAAAARHFETAIAARPDFALAHYNLGLARARLGDEAGAIAACERALVANPRFALGWETLGSLHRLAGHPADARRCFETALTLQPDPAAATRMRAWLAELQADFDRDRALE